MKTIKNLLIIILTGAVVAGCTDAKYLKTPGGMPYKVYKGKDTQRIATGNFIKVHLTEKINDSVYFTTNGALPLYIPVLEQTNPYDISEVWTKIRVGDSIVATRMMDTFIKRNPQNIPPQFKKGDRIITSVKVLGVFTSDSLARADEEKGRKDWAVAEIKTIEKYLADKNISAQKTKSGAFVQTLTPGTGNPVDSGKYVSVNYTGTTFTGKKFDSNTDTAFHHVAPFGFTVGVGEMIKGFDEAVELMKVGESARIYIPSLLAYGPQPGSPLLNLTKT